jgi:hypothetical protein
MRRSRKSASDAGDVIDSAEAERRIFLNVERIRVRREFQFGDSAGAKHAKWTEKLNQQFTGITSIYLIAAFKHATAPAQDRDLHGRLI